MGCSFKTAEILRRNGLRHRRRRWIVRAKEFYFPLCQRAADPQPARPGFADSRQCHGYGVLLVRKRPRMRASAPDLNQPAPVRTTDTISFLFRRHALKCVAIESFFRRSESGTN